MEGSDPTPLPSPDAQPHIAGFWRRVGAFTIDTLLLGAIGWAAGFVLIDYFAALGPWGRCVGFCVSVLYFGLMNSRLSGGQTLGKRISDIQVVSRDGIPIGVGRSFFRAIILAIPFFLNGTGIPTTLLLTWVGILVSVLIFGLGLTILYLIAFNRRTRQSLHDLIVGTCVMRKAVEPGAIERRMWNGHYVVVAIVFLGSFIMPPLLGRVANTEFFKPLMAVQQTIQRDPSLWAVWVNEGTTQTWGQQATRTTFINVKVVARRRMPTYDALANQIAAIVLRENPRAKQKDAIVVTIVYGYDIGISSYWFSTPFSFSPADWEKRLALSSH